MNQDFDPYHRWLGIAPKHQPPNHYRLLGLEEFEPDPEVITDAAERQIAHVRRYALGEHAELSQQVLNELSRVKWTLLDENHKAAYDAELRASRPVLQPAAFSQSPPARVGSLPVNPSPGSPSPLQTYAGPRGPFPAPPPQNTFLVRTNTTNTSRRRLRLLQALLSGKGRRHRRSRSTHPRNRRSLPNANAAKRSSRRCPWRCTSWRRCWA